MSRLQTRTIKKYESDGFFVINLIATNHNGIPDLLCLKDGFKPIFIEVQENGDKVSPLQEYIHKQLKKQGFTVIIEKA